MRYIQRCSTPRGMRLQRPWQWGCLGPSESEICFSMNCDKFRSCFTSPCTSTVFPCQGKKEDKKIKPAAQQSSKPFAIILMTAAQKNGLRGNKVCTAAKETEGQSTRRKNIDNLPLCMMFWLLNNCSTVSAPESWGVWTPCKVESLDLYFKTAFSPTVLSLSIYGLR